MSRSMHEDIARVIREEEEMKTWTWSQWESHFEQEEIKKNLRFSNLNLSIKQVERIINSLQRQINQTEVAIIRENKLLEESYYDDKPASKIQSKANIKIKTFELEDMNSELLKLEKIKLIIGN